MYKLFGPEFTDRRLTDSPADADAFDFEGQTVQLGTSLENAHDGMICDLYGHVTVAEWAGDLGWNACPPACLVCRLVSHHIYYSSVGRPQGLYRHSRGPGMVPTRSVRKVILVAIASPLDIMISTTRFSAIRAGHPAVNAGLTVGPDTKPTKMHHLCMDM